MSSLKSRISRRRKHKHHTKKRRHSQLRKNKTRERRLKKYTKKGGDITYYPISDDSKPIWTPEPTENVICSTNARGRKVCLAFGGLSDDIKAYFNGFTTFHNSRYAIQQIGKPSMNGFVIEIENQTRGYTALSVLKSAQEPSSDNLMYEYIVGQYVNKVNKVYPCFVETYGLYAYKNEDKWDRFSTNPIITDLHALIDALKPLPTIDYSVACTKSKYLAILIQHLKNPTSLYSLLKKNQEFIDNELMFALFQLYVPLSKLMDNFTHYDLHLDNVLMYEPDKDKYIHYHYHFTAGGQRTTRTTDVEPMIVSFKSSYMLKIIDYGRCYFNDEESKKDSKKIYKEICRVKECNTPSSNKCGDEVGFEWLEDDTPDPLRKHYISSQHKNVSHDLLALVRIKEATLEKDSLCTLTPDLLSLNSKAIYSGDYGTKEIETMGYPRSINNVRDAASLITDYVKSPAYQARNNKIYRREEDKLGDLHIYMYKDDKGNNVPMRFIPYF